MNARITKRFAFRLLNCFVSVIVLMYAFSPVDLQTTHAQGVSELNRVFVDVDGDQVSATYWTVGVPLTLTVDEDTEPGNGLIYSATRIAQLMGNGSGYGSTSFNLWQIPIDLIPGWYVSVTDGSTTQSTQIVNGTFDYVDLDQDIAGGTGPTGRNAQVVVNTGENEYSLDITIGPGDTWTADFGSAGMSLEHVEWATVDIWDVGIVSTVIHLPYPITFGVHPEDDTIEGWEWPEGATVNIAIDRPPLPGTDYGTTAVAERVPGDPGHTLFYLDKFGYDINVGDMVTVTDGTTTKQHIVRNLTLSTVDVNANTLSGMTDSGQRLNTVACSQDFCGYREEWADHNGNWSANYAVPGDRFFEHDIIDIQPGSWVDATITDEDGDVTQAGRRIRNPQILARANEDRIEGNDWPLGSTVTIEIDDPLTEENPDKTASTIVGVAPWDPSLEWFEIYIEDYDLKPGDIVIVTGGNLSKQLILENLLITDFDLDAEIVHGTADAGQLLYIQACNENFCAIREETAGQDGNWVANFAIPGDQEWEQDTADIRGGIWLDANINDGDGDMSRFGWSVPFTRFHARLIENNVEGMDWPIGNDVTLTIDNEFIETKPVIAYDNDSAIGSVLFDDLHGIDLASGMSVVMTNGTITKILEVSDLMVTGLDLEADTVWGIGTPDAQINVGYCNEQGCLWNRWATVQPNSTWSVDFSVVGAGENEQEILNITYGMFGAALEPDDDGDHTEYQWGVDWVAPPSIPLVFAISSPVDISVPRATLENISVLNTLNESLYTLDNNNMLVPLAAATEPVVSDGGLKYTVTLRSDAVWSDGEPVTAQHFVDGILRVLDPNVGSDYGFILYPINNARQFNFGEITDPSLVGVTVTGPLTLEFTLAQPTSHFPQILASPVMLPARQDLIDQFGDAWTSPQNYVSNGPYRLAEIDLAHVVVEENPFYNGMANASFLQIAFDVIPDVDQQVAAYKNGDVDVLLSTPLNAIMNDPDLRQDLTVLPSPGLHYIGFSTQAGPTSDPLVRKALASAIDRQALLDDVLQTPWRVEATGLIPPELDGYQGSEVGFAYDPIQAQTFLAQAGYAGGVDFPALEILSSQNQANIVDEIASQWETVLGITVNVYIPAGNERFQILTDCQQSPSTCPYHGYILGWFIDYPDAYNLINDLFNPDSPYNYTGWENAAYQNLIDLAISESDPVQRITYLQQAEQILVETDAALAPLFHTDSALVVRPGIFPYYSSTFFSNLAYWSNVDPAGDGMSADVIGSAGGTVSTENDTLTVEVPASALQEEVTLSVTDLGGNYQITATQEELDVLSSFTIQPHGLQFAQPATLTFAWDDVDSDGIVDGTSKLESNIFLLKDGEQITPACSDNPNCDMNANQLSVAVNSLSLFELVAPSNTAPTANAGPDSSVEFGMPVTLNASASFDPDEDPLAFEWDFDNDGQFDDASGMIVATTFNRSGIYDVGLRVTDHGGLSSTDTVTITVRPWILNGFYQPVDMSGVYNLVKGGSTVPLKFEIFAGSTELTDIASVRSFSYVQISCNANAVVDEIETTLIGDSGLRYDSLSGQFIYNWKTPKNPGKCYRVTMTTMDGSSLTTYFKLK